MELNYDIKIHTSALSRLEADAYTNDLVFSERLLKSGARAEYVIEYDLPKL